MLAKVTHQSPCRMCTSRHPGIQPLPVLLIKTLERACGLHSTLTDITGSTHRYIKGIIWTQILRKPEIGQQYRRVVIFVFQEQVFWLIREYVRRYSKGNVKRDSGK